jgi:energy-coupling factor transporter transmembrane protein EcfT
MGGVGIERCGGTSVEGTHPDRERVAPLSAWGYLLFTGWAGLVAILAEGWWLAGLALVEVSFGLIYGRRGLRLLRNPRFWAFVLSAVAVGPFLTGEPDVTLGPLGLSREGLATGLEMAGRACTLTLAMGLGVGCLSLSDVVAVFDQLGLRGLGFAVALAMNLLRTLQEMATVTLQTIWLRGGMRQPWTALRLFLITTVANTLRYGDDVVSAAAVRAFDPDGGSPTRVPLSRADLRLVVMLLGCTGVIVAAGVW